jgi:hypothetical protein
MAKSLVRDIPTVRLDKNYKCDIIEAGIDT